MSTKRSRRRRWLGVLLVSGLLVGAGATHNAPKPEHADASTAELDFLDRPLAPVRGKILAVVTSTPMIPGTRKNAGYELTELARAYYVFQANGYAVDIASPRGGTPPVDIDEDDMQAVDHRFLRDSVAQVKVAQSKPLSAVDSSEYQAVFFVGGKGALLDFPDNAEIQRIVRELSGRGVIGAVCHGPAALLHVRD